MSCGSCFGRRHPSRAHSVAPIASQSRSSSFLTTFSFSIPFAPAVRCSPFPLVPYPLDAKLRAFWKHPIAFLQREASPIIQQQMMKQQTSDMGRRHQRPSVLSYFQHAVLSVVTGFMVYYAVKFPTMFQNNDLLVCDALFIACILTLGSTLTSLVDGVSHELDPYKYLYPLETMWPKSTTTTSFVPWPFVSIPLVSIMSASLFVGGGLSALGDVVLFSKLLIGCALTTIYIYTIDHKIRMALFNPPADLHGLVEELANDDTTPLTRLGVMLSSILCDASLVKQVWSGPGSQNSIGGPESEEIILCETLFETMANILLRPIDPSTEAPLDEDVLRIAILESMGGKLATDSSSSLSGNESTERHEKEINKWIGLPTPVRVSGSRVEHLSIPLVRGLCVFIGGFGKALTIICSSSATDSVRGTTAQPKPARCTWTLSPAVFVCLDFAVTAVARCIVRSLSPSGRTLSDWTSAVLSNEIPVALKALHGLREGIAEYSIRTTNDEKADVRPQVANQIGSNLSSPDHWKIVRACDSAATRILESARSPSGHGRINLLLDPACLEWKHELMARNVPSQ